jgi:hypothetical protein
VDLDRLDRDDEPGVLRRVVGRQVGVVLRPDLLREGAVRTL